MSFRLDSTSPVSATTGPSRALGFTDDDGPWMRIQDVVRMVQVSDTQ